MSNGIRCYHSALFTFTPSFVQNTKLIYDNYLFIVFTYFIIDNIALHSKRKVCWNTENVQMAEPERINLKSGTYLHFSNIALTMIAIGLKYWKKKLFLLVANNFQYLVRKFNATSTQKLYQIILILILVILPDWKYLSLSWTYYK